MFPMPPKRITLESLLTDYTDYRVLKKVYKIFQHYLKSQAVLNHISIVNHVSLLNIIRQDTNQIKLHNNQRVFWMSSSDMRTHNIMFGTTGSGMSSIPKHLLVNSDYIDIKDKGILEKIEQNKKDGYRSLSIFKYEHYEVLVQYKGKKMFILISFVTQNYAVALGYHDRNLLTFDSSFNQSIDIIGNNITFLLALENLNNDYKEILEQDISAEDKITLANMLNI